MDRIPAGLVLLILIALQPVKAQDPVKAVAFTLPDLVNATEISLADYAGKVIYLDFWASWCGPCRISLPLLNTLYRQLGPEDFTVLAVNIDEDIDKARKFLKRFPVDYPVVSDLSAEVAEAYKLPGMPTAFLINRHGEIVQTHVGFKASDIDGIRRQIEVMLAE